MFRDKTERLFASSPLPECLEQENRDFVSIVLSCARETIPTGNLRGKIWWCDSVATAIEERQAAFNAYRKSPSEETLKNLEEIRKNTESIIIAAKRKSWQNHVTGISTDIA